MLVGKFNGKDSALDSISASSTDLKVFKLQTLFSRNCGAEKTFATRWSELVQAEKFKFESKIKPLQVIWQLRPKTILEENRRF